MNPQMTSRSEKSHRGPKTASLLLIGLLGACLLILAPPVAAAEPETDTPEASLERVLKQIDLPPEMTRRKERRKPAAEAGAQADSLVLTAGQGQLVRLPRPATRVFVGDPNISDARVVSPTSFYLFGDQVGRTNVLVTDARQQVVAKIDLEVVADTRTAEAAIAKLHPESGVVFEPVGEGWLAGGHVGDAAAAADLAAMAAMAGDSPSAALNNVTIEDAQQINIRVRFAEVSRRSISRIGINWDALVDSGDLLFGLSSGQFFLPGGGIDALNTSGTIFGSGQSGDVNIDLLIDALQREGFVSILAEPNLTAVNGEQASFLAGGEIPVPVPRGGANDGITIDFKPFGVSLDFLPTILPKQRINLKVRPEVSELVSSAGIEISGFAIPALSVRRTETSVQLASGQTLAVAGMFKRNLSNDVDKFPVLGELPVLGQLFQSKRYQRDETELVILITPYLVEPTRAKEIALPTDSLREFTAEEDGLQPGLNASPSSAGFIIVN